jgi:hypothetical protein
MFRFLMFFVVSSLSFASDYADLQALMGQSFLNGNDPYSSEYVGRRPWTRRLELVENRNGLYLVDNFRHGIQMDSEGEKGQANWSSALIDVSRVQRVVFMLTKFDVINFGPILYRAGHAQMLFEFADGGVMTPSGPVKGIVFSFEVHLKEGEKYSAIWGGLIKGQYETTIVVGTRRDLFEAAKRDMGAFLVDLDLDQAQKQSLLVTSLKHALDKNRHQTVRYHTIKNSCITAQFDIMQEALGTTAHEWVPRKVLKELKSTGLVTEVVELKTGQEIFDFAQNHFADDAVYHGGQAQKQRQLFLELYQD